MPTPRTDEPSPGCCGAAPRPTSCPPPPPAPVPPRRQTCRPTLGQRRAGSNASGPPPVVMSARIGEHEDRTRLVLELSDPVNLRAFTLTNPDRVVIDMPEVAWRLGAPPRAQQPRRRSNPIATACSAQAIRAW